jgi:hypothetical protein
MIMHPALTNSIVMVTMASSDARKEESQSGESPLSSSSKQLLGAFVAA